MQNHKDYNLPALLKKYDQIIFDNSALDTMPVNLSACGFKTDPPIHETMQYTQFLIRLFENDVDKKLVVLEDVLKEFQPNDKKYHKSTEKRWGLVFKKKCTLVELIKKTHPCPKLGKIEKELLNECREKYDFLKRKFNLRPIEFLILTYGLIASKDKKCALLTNDSGIIKAHRDLMAFQSDSGQYTKVFDVYTMIKAKEFYQSY